MKKFTREDGISINYEITGEGEPVLMIMGITAPHQVWEVHQAAWEKEFQCIMPDNRGVGYSSKPSGDYTTEMMAQDHLALLDHLGVEKVHVVGCSMGSTIAQQIALLAPEKVKSLVLMCPWARCDAYAKSTFRHMVDCYAHLTADKFMEWIQLLIFDKSSWDDPETLKGFLEGRAAAASNENPQPLHGLKGQATACINHDVFDQLEKITAPTLVIGGENDLFTPRWMAEEIHHALPNSQLHLYPNAGHGFHFERVDDFNTRVAAFMKSNA